MVELLLNAGANIDAKTNDGKTPKDIAAQNSKIVEVKKLIPILKNTFLEDQQRIVDLLVAATKKHKKPEINRKYEEQLANNFTISPRVSSH